MQNWKRRTFKDKDMWILIVAIIALLSLFGAIRANKSAETLPVYTEESRVEEQVVEQVTEADTAEMQIYTDENLAFTLNVPADWDYVVKGGYPTYIHKASGSSIQIQVDEYNPYVNNMSEDMAASLVSQNGKTYSGFSYTSNTSYELLYQDLAETTYDYIEAVYWDRDHVITLLGTFDDQYYDRMGPYYDKILDSFSWNRENPVPDGFYLAYVEDSAFEIGLPDGWPTAYQSDWSYTAVDEETGASIIIQVSPTETDLSGITASDVITYLNMPSGYMMQDFQSNQLDTIAMLGSYSDGTQQWTNKSYLISNGEFLYTISYDFPQGIVDESIAETSISLFRYFGENFLASESHEIPDQQA